MNKTSRKNVCGMQLSDYGFPLTSSLDMQPYFRTMSKALEPERKRERVCLLLTVNCHIKLKCSLRLLCILSGPHSLGYAVWVVDGVWMEECYMLFNIVAHVHTIFIWQFSWFLSSSALFGVVLSLYCSRRRSTLNKLFFIENLPDHREKLNDTWKMDESRATSPLATNVHDTTHMRIVCGCD